MKFKAKVFIRLRAQVDDSPGNAVRDCCKRMSDLDIKKLRLGKIIDIYLIAPDKDYAIKELNLLSSRFLSNEVMEDWSFEITEVDSFPRGVSEVG
jgi:phosphoribosylformylglycinamidine synthase